MKDAAIMLFAPGGWGFIITEYFVLSIAEFIVENWLRVTNPLHIPMLKSGAQLATIFIFLVYVGMLIAKYNVFTTTGTF